MAYFKCFLITLPEQLRGNPCLNSTAEGTLNFAIFCSQKVKKASSLNVSPSTSTTKALMASSRISSGTPITATSWILGCDHVATAINKIEKTFVISITIVTRV